MKDLNRIVKAIEKELDDKNRLREEAINGSRRLIRVTKEIISSMSKGKGVKAQMDRMKKDAARLWKRLERHPDLLHSGYVQSAQAELVEVCVLDSITGGRRLETPKELNVTPEAYLLGIGDVIGELRRVAVDALRKHRLEEADRRLQEMETLYHILMRFDYPDALVSLRRKQDVARGVIERTRGELLVAARESALKEKMDKVIRSVRASEEADEQAKKGGKKGKRKRGRRRRKGTKGSGSGRPSQK
jgi:translin